MQTDIMLSYTTNADIPQSYSQRGESFLRSSFKIISTTFRIMLLILLIVSLNTGYTTRGVFYAVNTAMYAVPTAKAAANAADIPHCRLHGC